MSNIIRFPELKPDPASRLPEKAAGGLSAEILFFTGVRYSRRETRTTGGALHRQKKEKAEA
ncbi:MAG: hypothetical protein LJE67_13935 [Salaquimonas sp.]|jgi:hypothetical protein|nr:hypothetical protein [Salaquimonas sp.]